MSAVGIAKDSLSLATFSWSWTCLGGPSGTISVRVEEEAIVLIYRARGLLAAE
jgi:hypothetical protein